MAEPALDNVRAIRPDLQVVERRVADIDDGYTRIANELLEAIASADLTARQLKVMLAYVRKTYGFNKKTDRIADEQIAHITGLSRQNVNKAKKELLSMNCLLMDGSRIGVNKEVSVWQFSKCLQVSNLVSKPETLSVSNLETNGVSKPETHKRHTLKTDKETITPIVPKPKSHGFDPMAVDIPEWLSKAAWQEWVQYRKESRKSINSQLTVTKAFNKLQEYLAEGNDPVSVINHSIANSYQGLYPPKANTGKRQGFQQPSKPMNHIPEGFTG